MIMDSSTLTFFQFVIILMFVPITNSSESQANGNDYKSQSSERGNNNDNIGISRNKDEYKGHFEPFGESGSKTPVQEITGYPDANNFFLDYVLPSVPVLMKGAATLSPAFHKWTDDYLLRLTGLEENRNVEIEVESGKKENRDGGGWSMTFRHFLKVYNDSDLYLVTDVLPFMEPYFTLPCPLQCPQMNQVPMKYVMWFSSGGTKSVVHTDGEENINCLYRGNKTLVMLDPAAISSGTILDNIHGVFSKLDVDSVDLNQYPTLRGASFITATMEPGDCLYIPRRWIHQVRSFGSNMAVNVWFHYIQTLELIRTGQCTGVALACDPTFYLGRIKHPVMPEDGIAAIDGIAVLRLFFEHSSIHGDASVTPETPPMTKEDEKVKTEEFVKLLIENELDPFAYFDGEFGSLQADGRKERYVKEFCDLIRRLDVNSDGILTSLEFEDHINDMWSVVIKMFERILKRDNGEYNDDTVDESDDNDYDDDGGMNKKDFEIRNDFANEGDDDTKGRVSEDKKEKEDSNEKLGPRNEL